MENAGVVGVTMAWVKLSGLADGFDGFVGLDGGDAGLVEADDSRVQK